MGIKRLIEKFWYSQSKLLIVFWPLQLPFLFLVTVKRWLYLKSLLKSKASKAVILVVGNLSVGGTGKTPFINRLIRLLASKNISAGIVSRGYHSSLNTYPHQVLPSDTAENVGDEAFMQYLDLKVPIVIDADRSRAVKYLLTNNQVDIVISDDGLQHYNMKRDLEILILDGQRQFGNQLILPFGPLREPLNRLKSVDFVIQNGGANSHFTRDRVELLATSFVNIKTTERFELSKFENITVNAIAGIGNTERFFNTLKEFCHLVSNKSMPDHYAFSMDDLSCYGEEVVVMTEKDAVKCIDFAQPNWYYLAVEMVIPATLENKLVDSIADAIANK